jgi:hypothetical protein
MHFSFPDRRVLNGHAVDYSRFKLFEGPFLNAEVGSQKLTMTYRTMKRVLDFKKMRIYE